MKAFSIIASRVKRLFWIPAGVNDPNVRTDRLTFAAGIASVASAVFAALTYFTSDPNSIKVKIELDNGTQLKLADPMTTKRKTVTDRPATSTAPRKNEVELFKSQMVSSFLNYPNVSFALYIS